MKSPWRKRRLPCPILLSLDLAEELLDKYEHMHQHPYAARGRIMLYREIAQRIHAVAGCQPSVGKDGALVCSLSAVYETVGGGVFQRFDTEAWAVPLARIAGAEDERAPIGAFI